MRDTILKLPRKYGIQRREKSSEWLPNAVYMPSITDQQADQIPLNAVSGKPSSGTSESAGMKHFPRRSTFGKSIAVLLLTWVLSVGWLGIHLNRGWVPHDDGMLAQTGERVLSGQLPHRDFDDVYTGGLSYLNAAAFKIFGLNLMSLRIMLLIFFAMWVPAVYFCASRFASPLAAGLVTLLSVAWSVPNYPAGMPSWYSLFFATFGVAALLEYLDTRATRWLFAAGLCGGLSCLIKSPGIYFVAAALLFFVYVEQSQARENPSTVAAKSTSSLSLYRIFLTVSVMALVACLTLLVRPIATLPRVYHFVLPGLALGLLLLARESAPASLPSGARFRNLFRLALPFVAGVTVPIALFVIPYAVSHSLRSIYEGVFIIPFQRLKMADFPPPTLGDLIAVIPLLGLLAFAWYSKRRESWLVGGAVAALMLLLIVVAPNDSVAYQFVWFSTSAIVPIAVGIGALVLNRNSSGWSLAGVDGQKVFLLLSALGMCSLIEFPYSSATYFCYIAPLLALLALALNSSRNSMPRLIPAMVAVFFIVFMVLRVTPGMALDGMAYHYRAAWTSEALGFPKAGGLRTGADEVELYSQLLSFVRQKATNGALYAGPDTPEIYFLGGYTSPSRVIFDAFESYSGETARVLAAVDATQPNVIIINRVPTVSVPYPPDLVGVLDARYPQMRNFGKYQVRWRP